MYKAKNMSQVSNPIQYLHNKLNMTFDIKISIELTISCKHIQGNLMSGFSHHSFILDFNSHIWSLLILL